MFRLAGRVYALPCGAIENTTEEEARESARAVAARTVAQLKRRQRKADNHPFVRYEARINHKSLSHQLNAIRFKKRLIEMFGAARDLRSLSHDDIVRWRDWLLYEAPREDRGKGEKGLSPKTVKEHIDWLAAVYNYAGMENPCKHVERPKKSEAERQESLEFFTEDEMRRMFSICAAELPQFYNGFVLFALTGCRCAEIQGLRPEDLDNARQAIWVTGKGGTRRQLILKGPMQLAWDALMDQMKMHPRRDGFIFSQGPTWARKGIERLCGNAFGKDPDGKAFKHGHPHMLRHTFATLALLHFKPAWDISRLAKWLGHKDISTTYRIYGHLIAAEPPSGFGFDMPQICKPSVNQGDLMAVSA